MKILLASLCAACAWGQSNPVVSGISHSAAHVELDKAVDANEYYLRWQTTGAYSGGVGAACPTTGGTNYRLPKDGNGVAHITFNITGAPAGTTIHWIICGQADELIKVADQTFDTLALPAGGHPKPTRATLPTSLTLPTTFDSATITATGCDWNTAAATAKARDGAQNHLIEIPEGCDVTAQMQFPVKTGSNPTGNGIVVTRFVNHSRLPPTGSQLIPAFDNQHLFNLTISGATTQMINCATNAKGWAIDGVRLRTASSSTVHTDDYINIGSTCSRIILEHVHLDGYSLPGAQSTGAIRLNGTDIILRDSYCRSSNGQGSPPEGYCVVSDVGTRVLVENSTLVTPGIPMFLTDNGANGSGSSDITIKRVRFDADQKYRNGSATSDGNRYFHRQPFEAKRVNRLTATGLYFDGWWEDDIIPGSSFLISPRTCTTGGSCVPIRILSDIYFGYSFMGRVPGGFEMSSRDDTLGREPLPVQRVQVEHLIVADMDGSVDCTGCTNSSSRTSLVRFGGCEDCFFNNISLYRMYSHDGSFDAGGRLIDMTDGQSEFEYKDNLAIIMNDGVPGSIGGCRWSGTSGQWFLAAAVPNLCKDRLNVFAPSYQVFTNNVLRVGVNNTTAAIQAAYPTGNFWPGDDPTGRTNMGYANASENSRSVRDFRLNEFSSTYRSSGSDGRAPGANWIRVMEEMGGVQNFSVQQINTTSIVVGLSAYGGFTTPGTAGYMDANTSATFANAPVRVQCTVHSSIPSYQTCTINGLTTGTNYYLRAHFGGEPFVYGGNTTPLAVRTR